MNILVIGNGFDLSHGLPTKYTDFLKFIRAVRYKIYGDVVKSDVNAWNELNLYVKEAIKSHQVKCSSSLERIYKDLIQYNIWINYFLQNQMYKKDNWIDFESEISRVIKSIDNDMKKSDVTEDTIVKSISEPFFASYFLDDLDRKEKARDIEGYKLCKNMAVNKQSEFLDKYRKEHPIEILNDEIKYKDLIMRLELDLNKLIRALEIYLTDFLSEIRVTKSSDDINNLDIDYVLSFNYTDTYEKLYDKDNRIEYDYIHGKAKISNTIESNNMVLGIDEYLSKKRRNKDTEFIGFKKYYQRMYKQTGSKYREWTDEIKQKYKEYQNRMNNLYYEIIEAMKNGTFNTFPYQDQIYAEKLQEECPQHNLYIFGHSLDITDKDILRDLILNDNVHTTIFYFKKFDDDSKHDNGREDLGKKIKNLVKVIGQKELIKRTGGSTKTIEFKLQQDIIVTNKTKIL